MEAQEVDCSYLEVCENPTSATTGVCKVTNRSIHFKGFKFCEKGFRYFVNMNMGTKYQPYLITSCPNSNVWYKRSKGKKRFSKYRPNHDYPRTTNRT
jgi:hypothetical protein